MASSRCPRGTECVCFRASFPFLAWPGSPSPWEGATASNPAPLRLRQGRLGGHCAVRHSPRSAEGDVPPSTLESSAVAGNKLCSLQLTSAAFTTRVRKLFGHAAEPQKALPVRCAAGTERIWPLWWESRVPRAEPPPPVADQGREDPRERGVQILILWAASARDWPLHSESPTCR